MSACVSKRGVAGARARRGAAWIEALVLIGAVALVGGGAVRLFSASLGQSFECMSDRIRQWPGADGAAAQACSGGDQRKPQALKAPPSTAERAAVAGDTAPSSGHATHPPGAGYSGPPSGGGGGALARPQRVSLAASAEGKLGGSGSTFWGGTFQDWFRRRSPDPEVQRQARANATATAAFRTELTSWIRNELSREQLREMWTRHLFPWPLPEERREAAVQQWAKDHLKLSTAQLLELKRYLPSGPSAARPSLVPQGNLDEPSKITVYRGGETTTRYAPRQDPRELPALAEMRDQLADVVSTLSPDDVKTLYVERYVSSRSDLSPQERENVLKFNLLQYPASELKSAIEDKSGEQFGPR